MESSSSSNIPMSFRNKFSVYSIAGGFFTQLMVASMVPPLLPAFAHDLGLTQQSMAFLLAIRASGSFISTIPFAFFRKIFGHGFTIFFSFLLLAGSSLLFAFPKNWSLLALAMLVQGLGYQGVWSTGLSATSLLFSSEESQSKDQQSQSKSQVQATAHAPPLIQGGLTAVPGWVQKWQNVLAEKNRDTLKESRGLTIVNLIGVVGILFAGASSGSVVGPLLGGFLFDYVKKSISFFVASGLSIFFAILLFFVLPSRKRNTIKVLSPNSKDDRRRKESRSANTVVPLEVIVEDPNESEETSEEKKAREGKQTTETSPKADKSDSNEVLPESSRKSVILSLFWLVLTHPVSASVLILAVVEAMAWGTLEATLPFHLNSQCNYSTHNIAIAFATCHLTYVLTSTGVDSIIDVLGTMPSIILGLLFLLISWPILALKGIACQLPVQCLIMGFSGVGFAIASAPCFNLMVDVLDRHGFSEYKLAIKVFDSTYTLGLVVGPLLSTLLLMHLPTIGVLGVMSGIMILCLPLACLYRKN